MAEINTVKGTIDSSELGITLVHEHLCFRAPEKYQKQAMDYQVELTKKAQEKFQLFLLIKLFFLKEKFGGGGHQHYRRSNPVP